MENSSDICVGDEVWLNNGKRILLSGLVLTCYYVGKVERVKPDMYFMRRAKSPIGGWFKKQRLGIHKINKL